jgi:hypothetical protein
MVHRAKSGPNDVVHATIYSREWAMLVNSISLGILSRIRLLRLSVTAF